MRWSKPAISIFLSKMVYFLSGYSYVMEADSSPEWASVAVFDTVRKIVARAANRVFVGPILCESHLVQVFGTSN